MQMSNTSGGGGDGNRGKRPGQITFSFVFVFLVFALLLFATRHALKLLSGMERKWKLSKGYAETKLDKN